jgi:hypothetical protein
MGRDDATDPRVDALARRPELLAGILDEELPDLLVEIYARRDGLDRVVRSIERRVLRLARR